MVKGRNGVFNVIAGNKLVFSKHDEGRFPDEAEVMESLRELNN